MIQTACAMTLLRVEQFLGTIWKVILSEFEEK